MSWKTCGCCVDDVTGVANPFRPECKQHQWCRHVEVYPNVSEQPRNFTDHMGRAYNPGFLIDWQVKRLRVNAKLPTKNYEDDAGWDFYYAPVNPGDKPKIEHIGGAWYKAVIPTGLAMAFPPGWMLRIWDRSSMGSKGMIPLSGVMDCGFRGEALVILNVPEPSVSGFLDIQDGAKIAQAVFLPVPLVQLMEVQNLPESARGFNGWGSSGV